MGAFVAKLHHKQNFLQADSAFLQDNSYLCKENMYPQSYMFMVRNIILFCLLGLFLFASCKEKKEEKAAQVYKTMKVERSSRTVSTQYSATMSGKEIVEIRPQVSGLITKILTDEGENVRKGQTLFVIDQVPYQAALGTAEAALKAAKARIGDSHQIIASCKKGRVIQLFQNADRLIGVSKHTSPFPLIDNTNRYVQIGFPDCMEIGALLCFLQ